VRPTLTIRSQMCWIRSAAGYRALRSAAVTATTVGHFEKPASEVAALPQPCVWDRPIHAWVAAWTAPLPARTPPRVRTCPNTVEWGSIRRK
jgi:hypothetical protein